MKLPKGKKLASLLFQTFLHDRPASGEDFFVFTLVSDDPETLTWEFRQTFVGSYEVAAGLCAVAAKRLVETGKLTRNTRVEAFQGDQARSYIAESAVQETRYRRERETQANN